MTPEAARAVVLEVLGAIAPEADLSALPPGAPLRTELDLDSMDFLNVVIGLHDRLGIDIPERDYPALATLQDMIAYVVAHADALPPP